MTRVKWFYNFTDVYRIHILCILCIASSSVICLTTSYVLCIPNNKDCSRDKFTELIIQIYIHRWLIIDDAMLIYWWYSVAACTEGFVWVIRKLTGRVYIICIEQKYYITHSSLNITKCVNMYVNTVFKVEINSMLCIPLRLRLRPRKVHLAKTDTNTISVL